MEHQVHVRVPPPAHAALPDETAYLRWRIAELVAGERRLRALAEKSADITALIAPNGTILYQSPSVGQILGYGPNELVGRSMFEYVHPAEVELARSAWHVVAQVPSRSQRLTIRFRHKDGVWHWLEGIATNRLHESDVLAVVVNFRDITESRHVAENVLTLNRNLERQAADLRKLTHAVQALSEAVSLDALYRILTSQVRQLLSTDAAVVLWRDPASNDLWCAHAEPDAGERLVALADLPHAIADWVLAEAQAAAVANMDIDPRLDRVVPRLTGVPARSMLAVPIMHKGLVEGVLIGASDSPCEFTAHDTYIMTALAGSAAITIENLRLLEAERSQRRLSETLRDVVSALAKSVDGDADAILGRILDAIALIVPADAVCFMRLHEGGLHLEGWRGYAEAAGLTDTPVPLEQVSALAQLVESGLAVSTTDMQTDPAWELPPRLRCFRACMAVPVRVGDKILGALCVSSTQPNRFHAEHVNSLFALADQAAVALKNMDQFRRLHEVIERSRKLSRLLVEVQENERKRIARDIHDVAGQALTAILVQLKVLEGPEAAGTERYERIATARHQVLEVMDNLRSVATRLRPPALDHAGLVESLREYVAGFAAQQGVAARLETVGLDRERFTSEVETAIYRIVQESLTNVSKHARARRVDVILKWSVAGDTGALMAVIEDDGCGFDVDAARRSGRLGLGGMEERVAALDGRMLVDSEPGRGATVVITIPCVATSTGGARGAQTCPVETPMPALIAMRDVNHDDHTAR
ncbi:MAG: GAF domain-containing protein [Chloroflexi bacterium]|nr:GAF domain-containing protein [Chloroflexota bacterium]